MKTILVTGGLGFVGSHTCVTLLEKGYKILIVDSLINSKKKVIERIKKIILSTKNDFNKQLLFYQCDLRDESKLENIFKNNTSESKQVDAVIHFAGLKAVSESIKDPLRYFDFNVISTINLLKIMEKFNCKKIVFSSSATIYGNNGEYCNLKEDTNAEPINPYGETKIIIEKILQNLYLSSNSWSVSILRYFTPIGAHPSGLIGENPLSCPNNRSRKSLATYYYSNGRPKEEIINRQLKNRTNFKDREGFSNETNTKDENFKDFLRNLNFYQSLKNIEKKFFRTGKSKRDRENK